VYGAHVDVVEVVDDKVVIQVREGGVYWYWWCVSCSAV
jgi:hypothetical protein